MFVIYNYFLQSEEPFLLINFIPNLTKKNKFIVFEKVITLVALNSSDRNWGHSGVSWVSSAETI